jgi:serine/threonine-protein kinase RsbW
MKRSIQIYCNKNNLIKVRQFVSSSLKTTSLTDIEINSLVLAVDEICANVIVHSAACDTSKMLDVCTDVNTQKAIFEIIDRGISYDLRNHKTPQLDNIIKKKKKGGIGLLLVRKIIDKIDFIPSPQGNIIRLVKHF